MGSDWGGHVLTPSLNGKWQLSSLRSHLLGETKDPVTFSEESGLRMPFLPSDSDLAPSCHDDKLYVQFIVGADGRL